MSPSTKLDLYISSINVHIKSKIKVLCSILNCLSFVEVLEEYIYIYILLQLDLGKNTLKINTQFNLNILIRGCKPYFIKFVNILIIAT